MSRFTQLLPLSPSPNSDSDRSQDTVIRDNDQSDAIDPGLSMVPTVPGEGSPKIPTTVTRIWNRPNGISNEYPQLGGKTYLDHAGTTLPAASLLDASTEHLKQNLYGNPHSASSPSASSPSTLAGKRVDFVRIQVLEFFKADPEVFDLVFVANATAAIKLVGESFHDCALSQKKAFWYGYHNDAHTSLVGVREYSNVSRCFKDDEEVDAWIEEGGTNGHWHESGTEGGLTNKHEDGTENGNENGSGNGSGNGRGNGRGNERSPAQLGLFAYPGQSNMTGRRLPVGPTGWTQRIRAESEKPSVFTLLDAASLASTTPLDLSDAAAAPDYVAVSFYKIFGFPDVGGLIVRKESAWPLYDRRYFGGGTVDMVVNEGRGWRAMKASQISERLEDGTVPFTSVFVLGLAIAVHHDLYGPRPMEAISKHTARLACELVDELRVLKYDNGNPVVRIYRAGHVECRTPATQGPIVALNLLRADGTYIGYRDVEDAANKQNIFVRSGSLCNPGGTSSNLDWSPDEMRRAYEISGHSCSEPIQVLDGRPTGMVRVSLGAMSTEADVDKFAAFVRELASMECNAMSHVPKQRVESWIKALPAVGVQV